MNKNFLQSKISFLLIALSFFIFGPNLLYSSQHANAGNDTLLNSTQSSDVSPTFSFSNQTDTNSSNNIDQPLDTSNQTDTNSLNNTDQSVVSPTFSFSNQTDTNSSNNIDQPLDTSNQTDTNSLNNTDQSVVSPTFSFSNQTNTPSFLNPDQSINSNSGSSDLPNMIKSWNFGTLDQDTTLVGDAKLENDQSGAYLYLDGNGYLTSTVNGTSDLNSFSISSWIIPNYADGPAVYTVISKEKQFALSINHIISPKKIAQFSVFDGIKWSVVSSIHPIENWTFLTATYDGKMIRMYVNGTLESSTKLIGTYLNEDGKFIQKNSDLPTSNYDIIVGAQYNSLRGYPSNEFSGIMGSLQLYGSSLDPDEINQLYQQTLSVQRISG